MPTRRAVLSAIIATIAVRHTSRPASAIHESSSYQWELALDEYEFVEGTRRAQNGIRTHGSVDDGEGEAVGITEIGPAGEVLWTWRGAEQHLSRPFSSAPDGRGGYLLCGSVPGESDDRVSVVSVDGTGNTRLITRLPAKKDEVRGYPLDGSFTSFPDSDVTCVAWNADYYTQYMVFDLFGVDDDGDIRWHVPSDHVSSFEELLTTPDGVAVVGEHADEYFIRVYASNGKQRRSSSLPIGARSAIYDDGIVVAGEVTEDPADPLSVLKVDMDLEVTWRYDLDLFDSSYTVGNVVPSESGYCLAVKGDDSDANEGVYKVVTVDSESGLAEATTFHGPTDWEVQHLVPTSGREFVAVERRDDQYRVRRYDTTMASPTPTERTATRSTARGSTRSNTARTRAAERGTTIAEPTDGTGGGFGILAALLSVCTGVATGRRSTNEE